MTLPDYTAEDFEVLVELVGNRAKHHFIIGDVLDLCRAKHADIADTFWQVLRTFDSSEFFSRGLVDRVRDLVSMPLEDVPLHLGPDKGSFEIIVKWRLTIGK